MSEKLSQEMLRNGHYMASRFADGVAALEAERDALEAKVPDPLWLLAVEHMQIENGKLKNDNERLRSELESPRKDSERLDWLAKQGDIGEIKIDCDLPGDSTIINWNAWMPIRDPRAAIDAAMAKPEGEKL